MLLATLSSASRATATLRGSSRLPMHLPSLAAPHRTPGRRPDANAPTTAYSFSTRFAHRPIRRLIINGTCLADRGGTLARSQCSTVLYRPCERSQPRGCGRPLAGWSSRSSTESPITRPGVTCRTRSGSRTETTCTRPYLPHGRPPISRSLIRRPAPPPLASPRPASSVGVILHSLPSPLHSAPAGTLHATQTCMCGGELRRWPKLSEQLGENTFWLECMALYSSDGHVCSGTVSRSCPF